MRGEYRSFRVRPQPLGGTTSACAENTLDHGDHWGDPGNYLRVRGEYHPHSPRQGILSELPPRARRIPSKMIQAIGWQGTTSACAENTRKPYHTPAPGRNYLRVRGEYPSRPSTGLVIRELPPRARRILQSPSSARYSGGTTSACAENTAAFPIYTAPSRNYLRVRGEYGYPRSP